MKRTILICAVVLFAASPLLSAQAAEPDPRLKDLAGALVGTWQSDDDTKFTRQLSGDGTETDRYEGENHDVITGTWSVFSGSAPPPEFKNEKAVPGAAYLEIRQNGDVLFFGLVGLTIQSLKMVYLERGNELSFNRLK